MAKIVVCDDDQAITEMIKIMLEGAGHQVEILSSGKTIQKKLSRYKPDLVLLDIWMPGIGGEEITKLLKRDENAKHIPIVIISALQKNEVKAMVKKTNADDFLPKPFDMNDLIKIVAKYAL